MYQSDIRQDIKNMDVAINRWNTISKGDVREGDVDYHCNLCGIYTYMLTDVECDTDHPLRDCQYCPIAKHTYDSYCHNTPYYNTYKYARIGIDLEEIRENNHMLSLLYEVRRSLVVKLCV